MNFKDFEYKRPDYEAIKGQVEKLIEIVKEDKNFESIDKAFEDFNKLTSSLYTMYELIQIRNTINTKDEFYAEENNWMDETSPLFTQLDTDFKKAILRSKFLGELEKKHPKTYFQLARNAERAFSEDIIEDLQEENKLSTEYSRLIASAEIEYDGKILNLAQMGPYTESTDRNIRKEASKKLWGFFEENEEKFDDIYDRMVKVRTRIAKKLGFNTFTELAYVRMNRLDYNQEMVAGYRKQILEDLVPVCNKLYQRQAKKLNIDSLKYYDVNLMFPNGNAKPEGSPDEILEAGRKMYHEMSKETGEFIDIMLDSGLMDVLAKPGKMSGGYMTFIPDYKVPFIFSNFNGTSGDVDVLTHEAGHAFQGYQSRNIKPLECLMPTYESCEIHSISMEFFAWPHMNKFFGENADKYRFSHLAGAVKFLPYGVLVDHFQHEVYNNPDMTPKERKETWRKLEKMYKPHLDYDDNEFAEKGTWWFKQAHIFQSPFYYIDYTLAQVCAFQFWIKLHEENPNAWSDYMKICKCGGTKSFLGIVEEGDLVSPFADGALKSIVKKLDDWLEKQDYENL